MGKKSKKKNGDEGLVIIVMGLPGTGKTEVSDFLDNRIEDLVRVNTDQLYKMMYPADERTPTGDFLPERLPAVYAALGGLAYYLPQANDAGIYLFEGSFRYKSQRDAIINAAKAADTPVVVLYIQADERTTVERINHRYHHKGAPDTPEDYYKIKNVYEWPEASSEYEFYTIQNSSDIQSLQEEIYKFMKHRRLHKRQ